MFSILPKVKAYDFFLGVALNWLSNKAILSQMPAMFSPKAPLPILGRAQTQANRALANSINSRLARIQYHSDPLGGTGDLYNHPEHTEYLIQNQGPHETRPRDCDDFAVYAYALARKAGVQAQHVWIWNLIVADQFRDVAWNHVVLGMTCSDAPGKVFVLDTCSAAWGRPHEFSGTKESVEADVRKFFGEVYKDAATNRPRLYKYLIDVPYPFAI